jgi:hypothetical protein
VAQDKEFYHLQQMHADKTQQMLTQVHIIEFVLIVVLSLALFWILAKEEEGGINVVTVPILQDNFSYLIIDKVPFFIQFSPI